MYEILPNKPTPIPMEIGDSKTPGRQKLESWLNKNMKIKMTDERILVGVFVCTDKDRNVILGNCQEYLKDEDSNEEPRVLGLAMVPGHHIVSILVDENKAPLAHHEDTDIL
ncbi:N-alpha-acetyltransferase 38, NatC auxiliary subunit-like isoform X2 [Lineus longissimus]|uniref:N-alpha-acetyltransferase 38, NatC auxiliary subunit-like isoform X2 n=1 Tax=Lineus longissimus TaxID=88925 RepID=UPI002B4EFFF2